jgi:hypothetical protein
MRKLATMVFLGFLLIFQVGAKPAQSGEATFKMTSTARYNVMIKVFSQTRDWQWPNRTTHWNLNDSAEHNLRIACQDGEKVCWGGAYTADNATYWGVGFKGDKSCRGCCLTCGNASHSWTLNDGAGSRPTGGVPIDPGSVGVPANR